MTSRVRYTNAAGVVHLLGRFDGFHHTDGSVIIRYLCASRGTFAWGTRENITNGAVTCLACVAAAD